MQNIAKRLIAEEQRAGNNAEQDSRAAFSVCEKLRPPLCTFTGVAGYRSLLSRALALAKVQAPLLKGVRIKSDGSFEYTLEMETQLITDEAAMAGRALADQLIGLLVVFIGEALTLRLVHDVWPMAALQDSKIPKE
jgi:hypothetical protein